MSEDAAEEVAAARTGLTPEQVRQAIDAYRDAALALVQEPEWTLATTMSGGDCALALYVSDQTSITLQIESHKERGEWKQWRYYVFNDDTYETFFEAKKAALALASTEPPDLTNVVPMPVTPAARP